MDTNECYVPGNVNIGKREKTRRMRNGWIYLVLTFVVLAIMVFLDLPRTFRLLIYIPATLSALGFLQSRASFCVYYGLKGEYKLDDDSGEIEDKKQIILDRKTSINILIIALSVGFAVTVLTYLLF